MNRLVNNTHKVGIMTRIYANVSLHFVKREKLHVMHLYILLIQSKSARVLPYPNLKSSITMVLAMTACLFLLLL